MPANSYDGFTEQDTTGYTAGDNQSMYTGFEWDNERVAWNPGSSTPATVSQPAQDGPDLDKSGTEPRRFGSAHPSTFQVVFCDGSVHGIAYDIDSAVHRALAHRFDGGVVQVDGL